MAKIVSSLCAGNTLRTSVNNIYIYRSAPQYYSNNPYVKLNFQFIKLLAEK